MGYSVNYRKTSDGLGAEIGGQVSDISKKHNDFSPWRFSIAPMMEWTDRHYRVLARLHSRKTRLYTEMVTSAAIVHGDRERLLGYDPSEHPLAVQLGGSDPADLARAARICAEFAYDEIDLNVGCPSDRVQNGRLRRLPDARSGACRALCRGDEGGVRSAGHGQMPHRRRRPGTARGFVRHGARRWSRPEPTP